jgi:hypothetical protein
VEPLVSRLIVPIIGKTLWSTGDVKLRVDLNLELKDAAGSWPIFKFRVDSGTDITTFPANEAKRRGLPMPLKVSTPTKHTQTGLEIRSGVLRFRIVGMDATEYTVPCLFLGDPNTQPNSTKPATMAHPLLQPLALLNDLKFEMLCDPASTAIYGHMVVEKR